MAQEGLPTFKPSEKQKAKIKPAGWMLIGVVLLLLVGVGGLIVNALAGSKGIEPLEEITPVRARATATAVVAPKPTPVVWWQTELRKVKDPFTGKEYLMAPDSVVQEIIAQMKADIDEFSALDPSMMSLREYKKALARYYSGEMLEEALSKAEDGFGYYHYRRTEEGVSRNLQVKSFSPDGLECTLGTKQTGGVIHLRNWESGETKDVHFDGLVLQRLRYDLKDRRWKVKQTLEIVPLDE